MNLLQMFDYFDRLFGALLVSKTFAEKNGFAFFFDCLLVSKHTSVLKKPLEGNLLIVRLI